MLKSRFYFHAQVSPVKVIKIIEIVKKKIHALKGFWLMRGEEVQHVKIVKEDIYHNLGEQFRLWKWTFSHIVQVHSWSILKVIQTGPSQPLQYLQLRPSLQHGRDQHEQRGRCRQRLRLIYCVYLSPFLKWTPFLTPGTFGCKIASKAPPCSQSLSKLLVPRSQVKDWGPPIPEFTIIFIIFCSPSISTYFVLFAPD